MCKLHKEFCPFLCFLVCNDIDKTEEGRYEKMERIENLALRMASRKIFEPCDQKKPQILISGYHGSCGWEIDYDGVLYIYPENGICGTLSAQLGFNKDLYWNAYSNIIRKVIVENGVRANKQAMFLFSDLKRCKSIDASLLDVSNTINFNCMFECCKNLEEINIQGWDTSSAISMSGMFAGCKKLKELNLTGFKTSKVKDMCGMFFNCKKIKILDLSSFDLSLVQNMSFMFAFCARLKTLNFENLRIKRNCENCERSSMFFGCLKLKIKEITPKLPKPLLKLTLKAHS